MNSSMSYTKIGLNINTKTTDEVVTVHNNLTEEEMETC